MGLLDDAIREHLELKRRHGADPDEVARQENEALGETRRAEFARPEGAEPADAPVSAEPEPETDFPVPEFDAGRGRDDDTLDDEPQADEPPETAEYEVDFEEEEEEEATPPAREPFDAEADAPPATRPPERDEAWLDEDRDEVPAEEALDHPRGSDEDVLEETPDFLQETPEHDRLWFEQRPPRDFDWDK